jgi:acyl carrier protein
MSHSITLAVRRFVAEELRAGDAAAALGDGASLREAGILDRAAVYELLCFLEERFGISVGDDELRRDNFDSIRAISDYVSRKMSERGLLRVA